MDSTAILPPVQSKSKPWQGVIRPGAHGKFLFAGNQKLYVRGVTYGPFRPQEDGSEYHTSDVVDRDFAAMAANGINTVRTYTVPPRWLLDCAQRRGLYVMVGLPWEQHIAFLDDKGRADSIEASVRNGVQACAGHPALLCYAVGNEIPAPIVRWYGRERIERFILRLYRAAKAEDPGALVTYVNYPTTEYLQLPFLDFVCFNVYLESQDKLESYLARLQNLAGDRPLVLAEIGLDSRRNGLEAQAETLDWQVRSVFSAGGAGAFVFAWTDEWHRGGYDIDDWDFGLTTRCREPKPALEAVRRAYAETPFPADQPWPSVSVVVCSHNGGRTIRDCCEGLRDLEYPNYEVIVVDDGSTDDTAAIAGEFGWQVILTPSRGLSNARNVGLAAATGEIVAYTDDDARPDPHWLTYLAQTFMATSHAGAGGPNIPPPGDGLIADAVAVAPGGPMHVLLSDQEAEHIPGCNMAFRKAALEAVGGFDPRFRSAGDDVDICWRMLQRGWTLGFSPAAMVWHHRRNSVRTYWRQQKGYGRAEALLEMKWPNLYNRLGHLTWHGRLYGSRPLLALPLRRSRVYGGVWGSEPFQALYAPPQGGMWSLLLMPEWYLIIAGMLGLTLFGILWPPLFFLAPLLLLAIAAPAVYAVLSALLSRYPTPAVSRFDDWRRRSLAAGLYLVQPMARLLGRLRLGLTPWRRRGAPRFVVPRPRTCVSWSEQWKSPIERLEAVEQQLCEQGAVVLRGGHFDRWDLEVRGGLFGGARLRMVIEEHGGGKQLIRLSSWPVLSLPVLLPALMSILAVAAMVDQFWLAAALLGLPAILLIARVLGDCAAAALPCKQLAASAAARETGSWQTASAH